MSEWISVEDENKPKDATGKTWSEDVLMWDGAEIFTGFYEEGDFHSSASFHTFSVTHWQPLPEPPKEDM